MLKAKVPALVVSSVICLALGVALGIGIMLLLEYQAQPAALQLSDRGKEKRKIFEKEMAEFRKNAASSPAANPVETLVALVAKLDQLSQKPVRVELDAKQQQEIAKQLDGLADLKQLDEEEAKKRLDGLLKVLVGHKKDLELAGFSWPGNEPRPTVMGANPFHEEVNRKHLEAFGHARNKSE